MTRRILTADDVARLEPGTRIEVDERTTLTASARELARRRGMDVVELDGGPGGTSATAAVGGPATPRAPAPGWDRVAARQDGAGSVPAEAAATDGGARPGTIIVTGVGVNRPGVMSELTAALGELGGDIQDVSQRITGGYFNAILVVDIRTSGEDFGTFRDKLLQLSSAQDYVVTVIDERVFQAMHRI